MSEYLYGPEKIAAAVKASEQQAATRPPKRVNEAAGDLQVTHSIPKELYWNAVEGHGVDPNDTGYWRDMERYVPSIAVKQATNRFYFPPMARHTGPRTIRTRFGNATYRKSYT